MYLLAGKLNDLFHISDVDNDNCLDMNEFWTFGSHLWDSAQFFLMSTRHSGTLLNSAGSLNGFFGLVRFLLLPCLYTIWGACYH